MTFAAFLKDQSGAVTVDWVVLTSAIVGLGMATTAVVSGGVENLSTDTAQDLADVEIATNFGGDADAGGAQPYEGDWLAPGHYDSDLAWVQQLGDDSITGLLTGYASYANPDNVNMGTHNEPRNHDQYWMAYNEAIERDLEIPENEHL